MDKAKKKGFKAPKQVYQEVCMYDDIEVFVF